MLLALSFLSMCSLSIHFVNVRQWDSQSNRKFSTCGRYWSGKIGHKRPNSVWKSCIGRFQSSKASYTLSKPTYQPQLLFLFLTKINGQMHARWRTQEQSLITYDPRNPARRRSRSTSSSAAWSTHPAACSRSGRHSRRSATSACRGIGEDRGAWAALCSTWVTEWEWWAAAAKLRRIQFGVHSSIDQHLRNK